jgi:predicted dehydrogenase
MSSQPTRRQFLGTSAALAATWAGGQLYAAGADAKSSPNDTIRLGVIGCGARARQLFKHFKDAGGNRVIALSDVNAKNLASYRQLAGGDKVAVYGDYRKLLERKDVDAVIVATQAHWHVLPTIHACQAGKDVYLEKPVTNFIGEGRYAIEAAKKYNRIVQVGTQQHSRAHYLKAVELIQSGRLGDISEVKVWDYENWWPGRGSPANCDPPAELDWDFYVGPAPMVPYNPNIYYNYGYDWFRISGGGHQVAWGVHHFDVVNMVMGVKYPKAVAAFGGKYAMPDDNREWPDTLDAILEYGPGPVAKNGFVMQYTMRMGCRREQRSHAKCFFGAKASMFVDRSRLTIFDERKKGVKGAAAEEAEEIAANEDEGLHQVNFLNCLRSRTQPIDDLQTGQYATNPGHLINIAWQTGHRLLWDGEKEQVIDDPEANALVNRTYRAPWKLEV